MTSAQHNANGNGRPSIPLAEDAAGNADRTIGGLVHEATTHLSTLVRSEVELAKIEVTTEIRKGLRGSVHFIIALAVFLFSLFFFFVALAELLADVGLYRSAAFGIVFGFMLVVAVLFALAGFRRVRGIHGPRQTISEAKKTAQIGRRLAQHDESTELG